MKEAFAARPELIYFLSDGDYEDVQDAILNNRRTSLEDTLDQLNRDRSVKITVIFFGEGPRQRTILERIAREHGGNFRTGGVEVSTAMRRTETSSGRGAGCDSSELHPWR